MTFTLAILATLGGGSTPQGQPGPPGVTPARPAGPRQFLPELLRLRPPEADPCLLSAKERNKAAHISEGNTRTPTPAEAQAAVLAALDRDGHAHKASLAAHGSLVAKAGRTAVNAIAVLPSEERLGALRAALARHGVEVGGMRVQAPRGQPPAAGAAGTPPRRPAGGGGGATPPPKKKSKSGKSSQSQRRSPGTGPSQTSPLPPQQLVTAPWSVPVRDKGELTRATGADGGGVAWVSSAVEAASLAKDLHGCDGALALVTRRPIAKPPGADGSSSGAYPHEAGADVRFLRPSAAPADGGAPPPPRTAFMTVVVTQLGKAPVSLRRGPDAGAASATAAELVTAMRVEISEAAAKELRPDLLRPIDAAKSDKDRDSALRKAATSWVAAHASGVADPVHAAFRSATNRERSLDAAGNRIWTLTVKVKPAAVAALYDSSGAWGVCAYGADTRADKDRYAVIPLDVAAAEMRKARLTAERTPNTHGIVLARGGRLYVRCLHADQDGVARAVLGDQQADRIRCAKYEVSHIPRDLTAA
eukprot:gene8630-1910_t